MRILITLGTLLAVLLIPWTSLAPAWMPDAAGGPISPSLQEKTTGLAARLNPALGILPLPVDEQDGAGSGLVSESGPSSVEDRAGLMKNQPGELTGSFTAEGKRSRVVCENGVCRLIDESESSTPEGKGELAYARLRELGATNFRLDESSDEEARFACLVPISAGSRVRRRFEATGTSGAVAVARAIDNIESWLRDRQ